MGAVVTPGTLKLADLTAETREVASRARRFHRLEFVAILCTLLAVAAVVAVGLFIGYRQGDIRDVQEVQACQIRATAQFQAAVGDALSAPPAPNAERDAAVEKIRAASRALASSIRTC